MSYWHSVADAVGDLEITHGDELTVDQQIQLLQVKALLALGAEVSHFNPINTTHPGPDGTSLNGWGWPVPS